MSAEKLTYAGHSAVFIATDQLVIAIDPWLDGNPRCPPSLKNPKKIDLIALSHGHSDHAGDAVRLAKSTGANIAATFELAMILIGEGVESERVIPMNKGGGLQFNGITVTLTHAYHSSSYDTENGPVYAGEACGVVIETGRSTIYHAGDTALFSDMKLIGERFRPDVTLLPIGDRFTMGPREAARAAQIIGASLFIPIHFKTFDMLPGRADEFISACAAAGMRAKELNPGDSIELPCRTANALSA